MALNDFLRGPFRQELYKIGVAFAFCVLLGAVFITFVSLKYSWGGNNSYLESFLLIGFCLLFVWVHITNLQRIRAIRDLNAVLSWKFVSGPRPEDPDELRVWWWGRQSLYAMLALVCYMVAFAIVMALRGD